VTKLSWFALHCAHRAEFKVEEAFREGELVRLGCEAYCPTETKWRRERRFRRIVKWPLLPGYVFAGLVPDSHGDLPFPMVNAIEGVVRVVSGPNGPVRIAHRRPSEAFLDQRRARWQDRRTPADPEEPPQWPLSLEEIRDMEAAGAFDFTQDRILAEKASKLVRKSFASFSDLAAALRETAAA
jgi:transcription antitermination factor NusG